MTTQLSIRYGATRENILMAENDRFRYVDGQYGISDKQADQMLVLRHGYHTGPGVYDPCPDDVMAAAVAFYDQVQAAQADLEMANASAAAERLATTRAAWDAIQDAIPAAAQAELDAFNAKTREKFTRINEGGEGYVPHFGWRSAVGREIAARYGLDIDAIHAALDEIEAG